MCGWVSLVEVLNGEHATGADGSAPGGTTDALEKSLVAEQAIAEEETCLMRVCKAKYHGQWGSVLGGWLCLEVIIDRNAQVSSGRLLQGCLLLQALPTPQRSLLHILLPAGTHKCLRGRGACVHQVGHRHLDTRQGAGVRSRPTWSARMSLGDPSRPQSWGPHQQHLAADSHQRTPPKPL